DNWKEILEFVKSSQGTTDSLGLHLRFNKLPCGDINANKLWLVMEEKKKTSLLNVTLKDLREYVEEQKSYGLM
ncbi:unnamed protein product, partial [marine sediment metagenome]